MNPQHSSSYLNRYYSDYLITKEPEKPRMLEEQHYNLSLIEKYVPKKGKILDIGCGHGFLLKAAKERGWVPYGYDVNPKMAQYVEQRMRVEVLSGEFSQMEWPTKSFDAVTMCQVLEHIKSPSGYLKTIHLLLQKNGVLFISVPNIRSLSSNLKLGLEKIGMRQHRIGAYYDTHHHLWYYSPASLRFVAKRFGFKVLHMRSCRKFRSSPWKEGLQRVSERFLWHSSILAIFQKIPDPNSFAKD